MFALTKWYLDVVDERLNVFIGYWLALTWGTLRLQGHHHLLRTERDGVTSHGELDDLPPPAWDDDSRLRWRSDDAAGLWTAAAEPIAATLIRSERGEIHWQCLMPKARGRIDLPQHSLRGWGYVERIDMTVPIWSLPFERLHWGRAHTASHSLVWIQLAGATSQSLAWLDGRPLTDLVVADTRIETSACSLTIDQNIPLRHGPLISTVFRPLESVTRRLPRSAFMAHERKWVGCGRLHVGSSAEPATVIHEQVTW